jgi:hypothetical protein
MLARAENFDTETEDFICLLLYFTGSHKNLKLTQHYRGYIANEYRQFFFLNVYTAGGFVLQEG